MKRVFCPKCDHQIMFDETKYKQENKILAFVCSQCGTQFKIRLGHKTIKTDNGTEKEVKEPDFTCGYITVIENTFGYKQKYPLVLGDNVIGRRNKDTQGVDIEIITSDPSMGRKHCVITVSQNKRNEFQYTLRDYPSLTGTFLCSKILEDKDRIRIKDGDVITIGATTFILRTTTDPDL